MATAALPPAGLAFPVFTSLSLSRVLLCMRARTLTGIDSPPSEDEGLRIASLNRRSPATVEREGCQVRKTKSETRHMDRMCRGVDGGIE
jgi:hypothetical protein